MNVHPPDAPGAGGDDDKNDARTAFEELVDGAFKIFFERQEQEMKERIRLGLQQSRRSAA